MWNLKRLLIQGTIVFIAILLVTCEYTVRAVHTYEYSSSYPTSLSNHPLSITLPRGAMGLSTPAAQPLELGVYAEYVTKNTAVCITMQRAMTSGWRRGSVFRTSVCGWRPFSDRRLIYGWHVTTLWVKCPLYRSTNQANSAFHPFGVGKWAVIHVITCRYMDYRGGDIKRQTRAVYGCLQGDKVHERGLSLWPIGYTPVLSVTQKRRCSCRCGLWRYMCCMPLPLPINEQTRMSSDIAYRTSEDSDEILILIFCWTITVERTSSFRWTNLTDSRWNWILLK